MWMNSKQCYVILVEHKRMVGKLNGVDLMRKSYQKLQMITIKIFLMLNFQIHKSPTLQLVNYN